MKPKSLLDLCSGAGGAAVGYRRSGFDGDIVGVDLAEQPNYPFNFVLGDAVETLSSLLDGASIKGMRLEDFAGIHASPPCQRWSRKTKDRERHPDLITPLRPLLERSGLPWAIENVEGAPLRDPITLCGSSFDLRVRRHRLFETSFAVTDTPQCSHEWQDADKRFLLYDHGKWFWSGIVHVFGTGGGKGRDYWPWAMGCGGSWSECWMTPHELRESIPPSFSEFVGRHMLEAAA